MHFVAIPHFTEAGTAFLRSGRTDMGKRRKPAKVRRFAPQANLIQGLRGFLPDTSGMTCC